MRGQGVKIITISLTQEEIDKAKKDSKKHFGKTNVSAYIGHLIRNQESGSQEYTEEKIKYLKLQSEKLEQEIKNFKN